MNYALKRSGTERGLTLVELMITIGILALLASLAIPSYRSFLVNQQVGSASSDFLVSMMQARSEAIRLGRPVSVLPTDGSSWTSGWYLVQVNNSCAPTGTSFGVTAAPNVLVSIKASETTNSFSGSNPSFTYSATGFPVTSCASPYTGSIEGKLAFMASETGRERHIVVANSGRARICDPSRETC